MTYNEQKFRNVTDSSSEVFSEGSLDSLQWHWFLVLSSDVLSPATWAKEGYRPYHLNGKGHDVVLKNDGEYDCFEEKWKK